MSGDECAGRQTARCRCRGVVSRRTSVSRELLEQLPNLRLISQRGVYPHVDVEACTDTNTLLCSKLPKGGAANYAASELTWGLILAGMRQIPQQMASLKQANGKWVLGRVSVIAR